MKSVSDLGRNSLAATASVKGKMTTRATLSVVSFATFWIGSKSLLTRKEKKEKLVAASDTTFRTWRNTEFKSGAVQ